MSVVSLLAAIVRRDEAKAAAELAKGADPNGRSPLRTPLALAVFHATDRTDKFIHMLLRAGADPTKANYTFCVRDVREFMKTRGAIFHEGDTFADQFVGKSDH